MNDTPTNHLGRGESEPASEPSTGFVVARDPVTPPGDLVVSGGLGNSTSVQLKVQCDPVTPPGK